MTNVLIATKELFTEKAINQIITVLKDMKFGIGLPENGITERKFVKSG